MSDFNKLNPHLCLCIAFMCWNPKNLRNLLDASANDTPAWISNPQPTYRHMQCGPTITTGPPLLSVAHRHDSDNISTRLHPLHMMPQMKYLKLTLFNFRTCLKSVRHMCIPLEYPIFKWDIKTGYCGGGVA